MQSVAVGLGAALLKAILTGVRDFDLLGGVVCGSLGIVGWHARWVCWCGWSERAHRLSRRYAIATGLLQHGLH